MESNSKLVQHLQEIGVLRTPRIIEAFLRIDRREFVPERERSAAYQDRPLSIGEGQTISQPQTVAFMLELLQPQKGDRVLDIGFGSGWTTALLSHIAGKEGSVLGIEARPKLCKRGFENLKHIFGQVEFIQNTGSTAASHSIAVFCGDGKQGFPSFAPYNKILVSAGLPHDASVPRAWERQLAQNGELLAPFGSGLVLFRKEQDNHLAVQQEFPGFLFVPLQ